MQVRNQYGCIIEIPDDPKFRSLLRSLGLTPVVAQPPVHANGQEVILQKEEPTVRVVTISIFESLLNRVPEDVREPDEVALFVRDIPGFENFTEADAVDFLLYRSEKKE